MSKEQVDLSTFEVTPESVAGLDPEQLQALAAGIQDAGMEETVDNAGTESATATKDETQAGQPQAEPKPDDGKLAEEAEGILAKDGKHIIPYERLQTSEQRSRELAQQVEDLRKQLEGGKQNEGGKQEGKPDADMSNFLSDEELDELEADLPQIAKVLRAQQNMVKSLSSQVSEINADRQSRVASEEADQAKAWNDALAKNPKAAYLDATLDQETGGRIINATAMMYPNWNTMTNEQRADAIVKQYEAVHGEVKPQVKPNAQTHQGKQPNAKPDVPLSMSGIPGGAAPAVDQAADMQNKTGAELTNEFMKMTPEQIEQRLAML